MVRKTISLALLSAMLFLFTAAAAPAQDRNTPFNNHTEFYLESRLNRGDIKNAYYEVVKRLNKIEVFSPYMQIFHEETGLSLEKDVFAWMGNRVRFGIMGGDNYSVIHTALKEYNQYKMDTEKLSFTVEKIRILKNAIEYFKEEKGRLPNSQKELAELSDFSKLLETPHGEMFRYNKINDEVFEIKSPGEKFKRLGITGNNPSYHSKEGFSGDAAKQVKTFKLRNYLMAVDVADSSGARESFLKLEKFYNKHIHGKDEPFIQRVKGKHIYRTNKDLAYTFYGQLVLIADSTVTLDMALASMERPDRNLYTNKCFLRMQNEWQKTKNSDEFVFADLKKIDLAAAFHIDKEKLELYSFLKNLDYLTYYYCKTDSGIEGDIVFAFIEDSPVKNIYTKHLNDSYQYDANLLENIPAGLPLTAVYNMGEIWSLLKSIGEENIAFQSILEMADNQFKMMMGMAVEDDLLKSTGGELVVSYNPRDFLLSGILSIFQDMKEKDFSLESEDSGRNFKDKARDKIMNQLFQMKNIPFTFFVAVKDNDKIEILLDALRSRGEFNREYYKNIPIYSSDKLTFCIAEDILILHSFPGNAKVKQYIDQLTVTRERMGENSRYRDFKKGIKGRTLLMQYQDHKWLYTVAKGMLMFILPEFSDMADKLGEYGENWSSLSVYPKGIQVHYQLFKQK